jgi:hypothetical protein
MDLRVRKLDAHYHLPFSRRDEKSRLDRVLRRLPDEGLEAALERAGVGDHEEVCIRAVDVPVRLRLGASEEFLASSWASAVAEAIGRVLAEGGPGVVRYGSRRHALIDFGQGVARDDLRRAWAWRQLGWGDISDAAPGREAGEAFSRALATEPVAIVAVLRALADRGELPRLASQIDSRRWPVLAALALRAAGGDEDVLTDPEPKAHRTPNRAVRRSVARAMAASILARSAARLPGSSGASEATRRALATLALIEIDPGLAILGPAAIAERVEMAAEWLMTPVSGDGPDQEHEAALAWEFPTPRREHFKEHGADRLDPAAPPGEWGDSGGDDRGSLATIADDAEDRPLPSVRQVGATRFGGLLFLVPVLESLGVHRDAGELAERSGRPFRWVLHALACRALAPAADDPAALAFAGLDALAIPPSVDEPPATDSEIERLDAWIAAIADHLRERLGWRDLSPSLVVDRVARREARVVADPGWIEVRFSHRLVSTEVRRAGLDLNPGYVPWLGVVLTFVYE